MAIKTEVVVIEIIKVPAIKVGITISRNRVATKIMHNIKDKTKKTITVHNLLKLTKEVAKVIIKLHPDIITLVEDIITKATMVIRITKANNRTI